MTNSEPPPWTSLRRCPSEDHRHNRAIDAVDLGTGADQPWRTRPKLETALAELDRRRCAGGPLVLRQDGVPDRLEADEWIGAALAALPEPQAGPSDDLPLDAVLDEMEIRTVEDLRSFRRLVAVHAALAAVRLSAAPPANAPDALEALLQEIDHPSRSWT